MAEQHVLCTRSADAGRCKCNYSSKYGEPDACRTRLCTALDYWPGLLHVPAFNGLNFGTATPSS
jgi:hypothetical protein